MDGKEFNVTFAQVGAHQTGSKLSNELKVIEADDH